jgi:hypothetical protein
VGLEVQGWIEVVVVKQGLGEDRILESTGILYFDHGEEVCGGVVL